MASAKPTVAVVYYSLYGHINKLAKKVAEGAEAGGAKVKVFQVPETLPEKILQMMKAPPKDSSVPVIGDPQEIVDADAIIFGVATRYGMISTQMKSFMDATGRLWMSKALVGKIASVFVSTGTVGGGQETAALTMMPFFTHHGMLFAPIGYTNPRLTELNVHGGSPWGAGTIASGDGSRQPSDLELEIAAHQGKLIAGYAAMMKKGKA
jgi:NAD(P)H dehydrogenase (quinone)